MKHHFFIIPVKDSGQAEDELNAFYAQHRIISVEKHFVTDGSNSFWSLCLSCTDNDVPLLSAANNSRITSKGKIDYKDMLNEADFALYAHCRDLRKALAERDGVPVYALFTNEQLAKMVEQRIHSKQGLLGLEGVGQARVDKYGEAFLNLLNSQTKPNETTVHQP